MSKLSNTSQNPIILFDGVCNLCHGFVNWVIDHDPQAIFRFASLQSSAARAYTDEQNSIVLLDEAGLHLRSTAALRVLRRLGWPWAILSLALFVPLFLRDYVYQFIARHRYLWFGHRDTCKIPTPELRARFLDADEPLHLAAPTPPEPAPSLHLVERFFSVYLLLYIAFSLVPLPPWQKLVQAAAPLLWGVQASVLPNGSGDTTFNYVEVSLLFLLALLATALWLAVSFRRPLPPRFRDIVRTVLRYSLASAMLSYGWAKLIPTQFISPGPDRLLNTFADTSPMGLLWTFMGASTPYQMISGLLEVLAGFFLLFRRSTLLGAFLSAIILLQVALLNFCYDVPVKLYSTHLFLQAFFLLAPDLPRLFSLFVLHLPVTPAPLTKFALPGPYLPKLRWLAKAFVLYSLLIESPRDVFSYYQEIRASQAHPLHGLYRVKSPTPTQDPGSTWVRIGIHGQGLAALQFASGTTRRYRCAIVQSERSLTLTPIGADTGMKFTYFLASPSSLELKSIDDGQPLHLVLEKLPPQEVLLTGRGFHWINERPFNR